MTNPLSAQDVAELQAKRDAAADRGDDLDVLMLNDQIHRAKEAMSRSRPNFPQSVADFEQFLNEPPQYEDRKFVRDYRHEAYQKWKIVFKDILALASQSLERDNGWQRIETAPKDGTAIWLALDGHAYLGYCEQDRWFVKAAFERRASGKLPDDIFGCYAVDVKPTHWQPLPRVLAQQPPDKEGG